MHKITKNDTNYHVFSRNLVFGRSKDAAQETAEDDGEEVCKKGHGGGEKEAFVFCA